MFRVDRARGPVWQEKYRLPDGRQVQKKIGPAWTGRRRPPTGYVTKRLAEGWLRDVLDEARRGTLAGTVRTGATLADAAAEFLRYTEHDRAIAASGSARVILASALPWRAGFARVVARDVQAEHGRSAPFPRTTVPIGQL